MDEPPSQQPEQAAPPAAQLPAPAAAAPEPPPMRVVPRDPSFRALVEQARDPEGGAPAPTPSGAPAQAPENTPARRRGRPPKPGGKRALRTFRERLQRAKTPEDFAQAVAWGQEADLFRAVPASLGGAEDDATADIGEEEARPAQAPAAPAARAEPPPPAAPPPPELYHGQPVERVAAYAEPILAVVESLAELSRRHGFDFSAPRERVLFKGLPIERKLHADPVTRLTELLAVEAAERFAVADKGDGTSRTDRRVELALLAGVTLAPGLLGALKHLPRALRAAAEQLRGLLRRGRA